MNAAAFVFLGAALVLAALLTIVLGAYHQRARFVVYVVSADHDATPEEIAARLQDHLDFIDSAAARRGLTT